MSTPVPYPWATFVPDLTSVLRMLSTSSYNLERLAFPDGQYAWIKEGPIPLQPNDTINLRYNGVAITQFVIDPKAAPVIELEAGPNVNLRFWKFTELVPEPKSYAVIEVVKVV